MLRVSSHAGPLPFHHGLNKVYVMPYVLWMAEGKGRPGATIHMACALQGARSGLGAAGSPGRPAGGGASFPGLDTAMLFDSRGTKKAFPKVFPAFLTVPEGIDSFP